ELAPGCRGWRTRRLDRSRDGCAPSASTLAPWSRRRAVAGPSVQIRLALFHDDAIDAGNGRERQRLRGYCEAVAESADERAGHDGHGGDGSDLTDGAEQFTPGYGRCGEVVAHGRTPKTG